MGAKRHMVVVSFHTTTDALAFKAAAEQAGLGGRLAPIPRQLSAGCGMAWREPVAGSGAAVAGGAGVGPGGGDAAGALAAARAAVERLLAREGIEYEQLVDLLL